MFRSLLHRNYRLFFAGQAVSMTGSWMQQVALSWLVYRLTRDPFQLGLVGFVGQLPSFLLGFHAGVIVDRTGRRRLVLLTQTLALLQATTLAALTLTGRVEVWHLYALAAFLGAVNALDLPARQVMVGELVPAVDRHNAIALHSFVINGTRVVGPSLAGWLIGAWGEGVCFAVNALSFIGVLAALSLMREVPEGPPAESSGSAWDDIRGGIEYVRSDPPIRGLLILLSAFSVAGLPFIILMPVFAVDILHGGPYALGALMGVSGVGATIGSLALARRDAVAGLDRIVAAAGLVFAASLAAFAFSRWLGLSALLMVPVGLTMMLQFAAGNSLLQELSADRYRGRVMAFYTMTFMGLTPFGNLAAGALASRIGAPATVALGAAVCAAASFRYLRALPSASGGPSAGSS